MKKPVLSSNELAAAVVSLQPTCDNLDSSQRWIVRNGKLHKTFVFKNFTQAFGFMTQSAIVSEKMDHHPEWSNVYKTVEVDLITHHSKGITVLDIELAQRMEEIYQSFSRS